MSTEAPIWTPARANHFPSVLALMRRFYSEEKLVFDEDRASRSVSELLSDPSLGTIFLLQDGRGIHGYLVGCSGYSLEFGGRFVLLDELYISPSHRGHGYAKKALAMIEDWAKDRNIGTMRLEVNDHNENALSIYVKSGYINDDRRILTKWISPRQD